MEGNPSVHLQIPTYSAHTSTALSSDVSNFTGDECAEDFDPEQSAPLSLCHIFGINRKLGARILNKTPREHFCIYSLGHVASLLNFQTKNVHHFQGHETFLVSIEHDSKGNFVVTADKESVIIWDLCDLGVTDPMNLREFRKPFGKHIDIVCTAMSDSGKYVVIGSNQTKGGTMIQFWRWTFNYQNNDGQFLINDKYGAIQSIRFSKNNEQDEYFVVTLKYGIIFAWWDQHQEKLESYTPAQKKIDSFLQSCYVPGQRTVASVTNNGRLIVWSDSILDNEPLTNKKDFVKVLTIQSPYAINDIKEFDNMLVTGNEAGEIRFYDGNVRLLYVCMFKKDTPIDFIAPVLIPKEVKLIDADDFSKDAGGDAYTEIVYKSTCPVDYTLEGKPFIVREFYVSARTGDVLYCNIFKKDAKSMLYRRSDSLVAYDILRHKPWVICANSNGRVLYLDYENYHVVREQLIKEYVFEDEEDGKELKPLMTCIRISDDGTHLAIGYANGAIWMIDPVIITPLTANPLRFSKKTIRNVTFGSDPVCCAYVDASSTVTLLRFDYETLTWKLNGKYRRHNKPLALLRILHHTANKQYLASLGEDRLYIEYDTEKMLPNGSLEVIRDFVLEQSGIFTAAKIIKLSNIVHKDTSTNGMVILVADDQYKFKIFDLITMERLYMFCGPIYDAPIRMIVYFPEPHKFYSNLLLFATEKTLGCAVLPIDGNMFRYSGIIAHPKMISMIIPHGTDVFVSAEGDVGGAVWSINERNVMQHFKIGGVGLAPFCTSIPGGKEGWLFKEMQDMFFYMQIMSRGGDAPEERAVTDFISIDDLSDFMRSIGYFPSDYEIQCIIKEARRTTNPSIPPPTHISFQDAIVMYLNHKPAAGYQLDDIKAAIEYVADQTATDYITSEKVVEENEVQITLDRILRIMTRRGEAVTEEMAKRYLIELLGNEVGKMKAKKLDVDAEFDLLPEIFTVKEFCTELLGIEINEHSGKNIEAQIGDRVDPAEINSQMENRFGIIVPESERDEKQHDKDGKRSALKHGRIIKHIDDSQP